jgi:hypothetical protein
VSVESIFEQIRDRTSWPEPPERPLVPGDPARLRPAVLIPMPIEALQAWLPAAPEVAEG